MRDASGPQDATFNVFSEERLFETLLRVAAARVPRASTLKLVIPRDRVIAVHVGARDRRVVEAHEHTNILSGIAVVDIPLIGAGPASGKHARRWMRAILDIDRRLLHRRMRLEVGAHKFAKPRPRVLRVRGRMNTSETASRADELLERALLFLVEDVAGRRNENNRLVAFEIRRGEDV